MSSFYLLPAWLFLIEFGTRLALVARVVMRRRPINATLAWVSILLFAPFLGQFLYLLIGESRLGSRRLKRYERLSKSLEQEAISLWRHRCLAMEAVPDRCSHVARYGTAVAGLPPLRGNELTLYSDNLTMMAALVRDIDQARDHVHLLYYIWEDDAAVSPVYESILRAAARGVRVRLLADGVGSRKFLRGPTCRRLKGAGVSVVEALPAALWRMIFARLDLRNHRKIAVIDGRIGYCGSQNINGPSYRSSKWRRPKMWVDATVRVQGPAAQALGVTFLRDWLLDSDEDITDVVCFLPDIGVPAQDEVLVQLVPSGPGATPLAIHQALLTLIYSAREELIMTTPYFVPDEAMFEALLAAATRGVDVRLIMPTVSDSHLVAAAARAHYEQMLEGGIRIFQYNGGLLHAKTVTVDRNVALIGSTNFDHRSFFLNFEATMFIYDDDFASILRFMQVGYMESAESISLEEWRRRSVWERARDNCAKLMGPLL